MTTPLITDTQTQIGPLNLSGTEPSGVEWITETLTGWGSPGGTLEVTQRPRSHGGWAGESFLRPRVLTLSGVCSAPSKALLVDAQERLAAAVTLDETPLTVTETIGVRTCAVRRDGEVLWDYASDRWARWSIQVAAPDPRKYAPLIARSTGLPSTSGGLTWPVTWPVTWDGVTTSGTVSITNPGNIAGPVQVIFDGPVTDPAVTHVQSQSTVRLSGLTLASGQFLTVDMDRREVLEQGQSSRNGYITSRGWCELAPGANDFAFSAGSYDAGAAMTVTAPEGAWL